MRTPCRRTRAALAALLLAAPLRGQSPLAPELDLFSDKIVKPIEVNERRIIRGGIRIMPQILGNVLRAATSGYEQMPKLPPKGYRHGLLFHDGRTLRGELLALSKDEITWSRPDASEPLRFPRSEVQRIMLGDEAEGNDEQQIFQVRFPGGGGRNADATKPASATVKLPGGDWLYGDITGEDGKNFALKLDDGAEFKFERGAVEWLHFGMMPAPAFGFSGDSLAVEGWQLGNSSGRLEVKDGVLTTPSSGWIGRNVSPPSRFEVSFEVPKDSERGIALWLQPYSSQPNSYSTGTIELQFAKGESTRLIYYNRFERQTTKMPDDGADKPVRYRVLYDGVGEKLAVLRNGKEVGNWPLRDKAEMEKNGGGDREIQLPRSMCFSSKYGDGVALKSFRVQPWDGVVPKDDAPRAEDTLTVGKEAPVTGKFEGVTDKEILFAGAKKPRAAGTFVQLAAKTESVKGGDALLVFGTHGELAAADLVIRDGRAQARTSIAPLDVPAVSLRTIVLPRGKAEPPAAGDVLVFRNGDTLNGSLVAASDNAPVRWKLAGGQEVELQGARVAGVRLAPPKDAKPATGATLELRNGDRFRGELAGLADGKLRIKNAQLGELGIEREKLWALYPNPALEILDGGSRPRVWLGLEPLEGKAKDVKALISRRVVVSSEDGSASPVGRVYLDGTFLGRPVRNSYSAGLNLNLPKPPDQYELRFSVTDSGGSDPSASVNFSPTDGNASLQISLGGGELRIYAYNSRQNGRFMNNNREVSLASKLSEHSSRRSLRIFVDNKKGAADIMVDGVAMMKFGQQSSERVPGYGANIGIQTYSGSGKAALISDVWLGPWNGELPRAGADAGAILLANGDVASGAIGGVKDGVIQIESDAGPLDVPFARVQAVEFGGKPAPVKAAARVRLADGALLHLDSFRFENGALTAKSAALGELKVAAGQLTELALSPSPARFPKIGEAKKPTKKEEADAQKAPAIPGLP